MSSSEEEEFNDAMEEDEEGEEEEEEENGDRKRAAKKNTSYAEDDDDDDSDDDSDDDIPLAALAAKVKKNATPVKKTNGAKTKAPAKKASASKKPAPPSRKSSNVSSSGGGGSSDKTYEFASAALYQSESMKGLLIQRLLCRWWYAYTWPDSTSLPAKPPKHYDALDGFPGVYVCTEGDQVGQLLDLRDKEQCPSFRNLARKPSAELRELLLKALENQKAQLVEHEGAGTPLEKELNGLLKWATKLDPTKADREALKVLKASKLEI